MVGMGVSYQDCVRVDACHPAEPVFAAVHHHPAVTAGEERGGMPSVKTTLYVNVTSRAEEADVHRGWHLMESCLVCADSADSCKAHASIHIAALFLARDVLSSRA
jgi:hypothetical protein